LTYKRKRGKLSLLGEDDTVSFKYCIKGPGDIQIIQMGSSIALKTGAHKLIERVYSGNVGSSGKRIVAWRKEETMDDTVSFKYCIKGPGDIQIIQMGSSIAIAEICWKWKCRILWKKDSCVEKGRNYLDMS
jgi:hypothetical protein